MARPGGEGGAFENDRLYFAPYFFVHYPDGYDQFEYLAVIGKTDQGRWEIQALVSGD